MTSAAGAARPPSKLLLALETRALFELGVCTAMLPLLEFSPRGDGHPVLVLPGLGGADGSTFTMRSFVARRGYVTQGWGLGRNVGRPDMIEPLVDGLRRVHEKTGRKVSLIGWSAGGIFAREIAKLAPEAVRQVITLGSPFNGGSEVSNVQRIYEWLSGRKGRDTALEARLRLPPPVPMTCVFTRTDGIVAWYRCIEKPGDATENIEVTGSHSGLGHNPLVLHLVADRLAQREGQWAPFDRSGVRSYFFPDPNRRSACLLSTPAGV